jgi:hypothetical protein
MPDINDMDYPGEEIKLDKIRHIKYTTRGLKLIAKKFGSVVKGFDQMKTMNPDFDTEMMDNLTLLLHAGLIHEDKELTADDVENMLTLDNMTPVFHKILKAFAGSTPQPEEDEVSQDEPGELKLTLTESSTIAG